MINPLLLAICKRRVPPGTLQTTILFKGCPLHCVECHTPALQHEELEVSTSKSRCIGCRECVHGCPESALSLDRQQTVRRDSSLCTACLNCVEICPTQVHATVGYRCSIDQIMAEIGTGSRQADHNEHEVIFAGGEPLLQAKALLVLLARCGERDLQRLVVTTGFAPTQVLLAVARHTEQLHITLQHMDSRKHQRYTGATNALLLHNLRQLAENGGSFCIRLPLLPGFNTDDDNILATARFAATLPGLQGLDLVPGNPAAQLEGSCGAICQGEQEQCSLTEADLDHIVKILKASGCTVRIGP
ncbi:MAG: radical SAM protein [Desulfopila sp.]